MMEEWKEGEGRWKEMMMMVERGEDSVQFEMRIGYERRGFGRIYENNCILKINKFIFEQLFVENKIFPSHSILKLFGLNPSLNFESKLHIYILLSKLRLCQ